MRRFADTRRGLPDWPLWSLGIVIALAISITLVGTGMLGIFLAAAEAVTGRSIPFTSPGVAIGSTAIMDVAMVGATLIAARMSEGRLRLAGFGFRPLTCSRRRAVALTVATWFTFLLFTGAWTKLVGEAGEQEIIDQFGAEENALLWALTLLMVGLVAPFAEEVLFRGSILSILWRRFPLFPSALVTGAMFGLLHVGGSPLKLIVPLTFLGLLLCLLRAATGSLTPCIAAHSLNNSIAFGVSQELGAGWVLAMVVANVSIAIIVSTAISSRTYTESGDGIGGQASPEDGLPPSDSGRGTVAAGGGPA